MTLWKRLAQLFIAFATFVIVLVVGGLVALDWYLGSETLKQQVQEQVCAQTGLKVTIQGDLGVSVYPYFGLETGAVTVMNPPGFEEGELASASSVVAKVSLLPLLDHVIDFNVVSLEKLNLHVIRRAEDTTNLDQLLTAGEAEASGAQPAIAWHGFTLSSLSIKGLRLDNANLRYSDQRDGTEVLAESVRFRTGIVRLDEPTEFGLSATLSWPEQKVLANVSWQGELQASPEQAWVAVPDSSLQVTFAAPYLSEGDNPSHFSATLALDTRDQSLTLSKFKLGIPELLLSGSVAATGLISSPKVSGKLSAAQFTVTKALNHYFNGLIPPKDPGIFQDGSFSFNFEVSKEELSITELVAFCDQTKLTGTFSAINLDDPLFSFDITGNSLDFDRYYKIFIVDEPFVLQDFGPEFLGKVRSTGSIKVDDVVLAGGEFKDFKLAVESGSGNSSIVLEHAKLWDGDATGELRVNIRHESEDKHPLGLSAALTVDNAAASQLPILNGEGRVFQARGKASYSFAMPETMFTKMTNIDEVLRYLSCEVKYNLASGLLLQGKTRAKQTKRPFDAFQASAKFTATGESRADGAYGYKAGASLRIESESEPYLLAAKLSGPILVSSGLDAVKLLQNQVGVQLSGSSLPPGETQLVASAKVSLDTAAQTLQASNAVLEANAGTVRGNFIGKRVFEKDFTYTGPVTFESQPRLVFGLLDVEIGDTRDKKALRSFSGGFDLELLANSAVLSNIDVMFDDTRGQGRIHIEDFKTGHSTFDLHAGNLDINRYRPPKKERVPGKCAWPKSDPVPLPLRTLSSADIDGDLLVDDFRIFDISFKGLRGHATMKDGNIELPGLTSDFYGGAMTGAFYGTATRAKLECDMSLQAEKFNGADFMIDIVQKQYVDGDGTVSFTIHTEGATDDEFIANMDGKASLRIDDGSYRFSGEQNPPKGSKPVEYITNNRTGFDFASATFRVDKSVFMNEDFKMESSYLSATGYGNFNLDKDTIDLHLDAQYVIVPTVIPINIIECLHDPGVSIPGVEILGNTVREVLGLPLRPFQYLRDLLF